MACLWFLIATYNENLYLTWVGLRMAVDQSFIDDSQLYQYLISFYWAYQTITTVGFGDIAICTITEYGTAIMWMIIGVNFYSYLVGNITNMIANADQKEAILTGKI